MTDRISAMISPVYVAFFAKLGALQVASTPVPAYETLPQTPAFPCTTFSLSLDPTAERAGEGSAQVDVWHNGSLEATVAVVQAAATLMDRAKLATSIGNATLLLSGAPAVLRDPDTGRRHGVLLFRVLIHT